MKRKTTPYARNRFFGALGECWRDDLGLEITATVKSPFVKFVECASEGIYKFRNPDTARDEIVNVVRTWPRRSVRKKQQEES